VGQGFANASHFHKIPLAPLGHSLLNRLLVQAHDDLVGIVFGFAEVDVKGVVAVFGSIDPDSGNRFFLGVFKLRVDQKRFHIVFVLPGDAGAFHTENRVHNGSEFFRNAPHRKDDISGQRAGRTSD